MYKAYKFRMYPTDKQMSLINKTFGFYNLYIIIFQISVKKWKCEKCGTTHDRDLNASINIMFEELKYAFVNVN